MVRAAWRLLTKSLHAGDLLLSLQNLCCSLELETWDLGVWREQLENRFHSRTQLLLKIGSFLEGRRAVPTSQNVIPY